MARIGQKRVGWAVAWAIAVALLGISLGPVSAASVSPAASERVAQSNSVAWSGEFFDNLYLMGEAKFKTTYSGLNLFWGEGSPNAAIPVDGFSGRFGADPYFTAGTYRFYVQADDEVKIKVSTVPWAADQLDTFADPKPGQKLSFDVTFEANGVYHIQIDYRERTGDAFLYFDWVNLATSPQAPSFPVPVRVTLGNPWTVQYFNNPSLSGSPVVAQTENQGPVRDWGEGSPVGGVPADNFSVRFVSFQRLDPGNYEITAEADDGVRVFVNGQLVINEWHGATGATYTARFNHPGGDATFTVEYYDATSKAFVNVRVNVPAATTPPQNTVPVTGTTATVLAWRLNVRSAPNTSAEVLTRIDRGQTYPVVGSSPDKSWWQINVNGTVGWVSSTWVRVSGQGAPVQAVPTATPTTAPVLQQPAATGYYLTAVENVNIRAMPSSGSSIVGLLPYQQAAGIVGRTSNNLWWQVRYGVVTGWVSGSYVNVQPGINLSAVPITG